MRSLWSGVSGLRVHQVGMDVEGNNIANVNTYGFKYSRVNYSTMFSQTMSIATQPTANLGGRNAKQVGLGVEATATQRIHSQGNMQTTDSNYDVAISGNGFFLVSNDGGKTQYLTRDGAFNQDAAGNFVNSSGYVVQGWVRDPVTGRIDTSLPAGNLSWDPSMSLPANPSSEIYLNASLNSGRKITQETSRYIYSLDSLHGGRIDGGGMYQDNRTENSSANNQFYTTSSNALDLTEKGVDFSAVFSSSSYESLNLRNGQSFWFSYKDALFMTDSTGTLLDTSGTTPPANQTDRIFWGTNTTPVTLDITLNNQRITASVTSLSQACNTINEYTKDNGTRQGTGVTAEPSADGKSIVFRNNNLNGETENMKNIHLTVMDTNQAGELASTDAAGAITVGTAGNNSNWIDDAQNRNNAIDIITAHRYQYSSSVTNIGAMSDPTSGNPPLTDANGIITAALQNGANNQATLNYANAITGGLLNEDARIFHTTEDLRELMQRDARYGVDYGSTINGVDGIGLGQDRWNTSNINEKVTVSVNSTGRYVFTNTNTTTNIFQVEANNANNNNIPAQAAAANINAKGMSFNVTSYKNEAGQISTNDALTNLFKNGLTGTLDAGNQTKQSTSMVLSSFSSALQVYDSLGTKHLIRVEWTKLETTADGGNRWQMILRIDEPATFDVTATGRNNIIVGEVRFGNDGALVSYTPTSISFSGNNGSAPNQLIDLNLGASGGFNGLVSNDQTSGISQQETDGYPPGMMLQGMQNKSIDQDGNIIASFSNGIQQIVGKIAMGNVTNETGLEEMGSNLFRTSANSGSLTVGTSNTGGRGTFKSATLEMSNADLSLALTNLIVIQRGYQANSKTITTSDTMLNTLLQLKQ